MRLPAYAKLNLTLEVLGRRDDGFHQVATIMQTISLADVLEIEHDTRLSDSGVEFILKTHPKNSINQVLDRISMNVPNCFRFTEEQCFPNILKDSIILVTEASSTCLEAMAYGISVIVIENTSGLTYDPIPSNINKKLYRKTRTEKSLIDSLLHFLSLDEDDIKHQRKLGLDLRKDYFEPVTKEGISKKLSFSSLLS